MSYSSSRLWRSQSRVCCFCEWIYEHQVTQNYNRSCIASRSRRFVLSADFVIPKARYPHLKKKDGDVCKGVIFKIESSCLNSDSQPLISNSQPVVRGSVALLTIRIKNKNDASLQGDFLVEL